MSYDIIKENVPQFTRRVGDRVTAGSNNSTLILGTDRAEHGEATLESGYGHINAEGGGVGTGMAHLVVGRSSENTNFDTDKSFLYLSMKCDPDHALDLLDIGNAAIGLPSGIIKTDHIRIVARTDLKIVVGDAYMILKSDGSIEVEGQIKLGKNAINQLVMSTPFETLFNSHFHSNGTSPIGTTGPPTIPASSVLYTKKVKAE